MNKPLLCLTLTAAMNAVCAADIVIHAAGDNHQPALEYDAFRISEKYLTEMFATMLQLELLNLSRFQYTIATDARGADQLGALPEADGCTLVAVELHYTPQDQPDGAGKGLWIATEPDDQAATRLAQDTLTTWSSKKHSPYSGVPLHHVRPNNYSDRHSGEHCPALYINLDTFAADDLNLWPIQAQSMQYYAQDLAHALLAALNMN